ncbi:2-keto-4-pentenoate hydratase/2-oxohepta-3-ene-1,7-dioic acid hydratase in catechol pathway [Herbaspirillum sp. Sphag1AN]|uniref:fumarylacetoacetate hydrolase family protein n=1 Tax=unclassified Herbaspirillum TaxID=2624150 RepID=UPI00161A3B45|nr:MULTISPECIES: fumarylacetoacetate hydrolase family protein [unclassified Herbaspirillum]MBB3211066.1 2-keto-4-pentenoate hydratase/2-oxohepta-3-ene-1,7-dioic acid hydratase in catechol pathway [Herbaspirillum sp. Sphag1AN]MBB3244695.1 2-keto-4-pentenoate hydratase/2-oxohepta-3-ene-1,7-dioic acid hydratase in catechol pathway [Herbaspirillum sp. Sphag64]
MAWYAIATYEQGGQARPALVVGEQLFDLAALQAALPAAELISGLAGTSSVTELIGAWDTRSAQLAQLAEQIPVLLAAGRIAPLAAASYTLAAPFKPARIFATASNFYDHAAEMGTELAPRAESSPYCFMKADTSVTATDTDVVMPPNTEKLDWEVELGVIIGRRCKNVSVADAYDVIAGYTVFNDISARDLNRRTDYPFKHDWFRGKSFDTFGPMGPWVVPRDCIADPQKLRMQLQVNGAMMQNGTGEAMIFNIAEQIAYLSSILTLQPGDMIATGTPDGVGMGRGVYLQPGDEMIASIEGIGSIRNKVVAAAS